MKKEFDCISLYDGSRTVCWGSGVFRSASDYARLYVGPIEPQYQVSLWHDIPYYKGNTNVYQGRICYHGVVYDEVQLRFDQLEQRVAVLTPVKGVFCLPEQACIDWFEMDGRRYVHDPEDGSRFAACSAAEAGTGSAFIIACGRCTAVRTLSEGRNM